MKQGAALQLQKSVVIYIAMIHFLLIKCIQTGAHLSNKTQYLFVSMVSKEVKKKKCLNRGQHEYDVFDW